MSNTDIPFNLDQQILLMRNYVTFTRKTKIKSTLIYTGYYRLSRYGKYLLSNTPKLRSKPSQDLLFHVYDFDVQLRKILFGYCKKAEIQIKSHLSNSISLKTNDPAFYLNDTYYTSSRSENDKNKRLKNIDFFKKYKKSLHEEHKKLITNINRFPEFKEYRKRGKRSSKTIPSWSAFSYLDFGMITNLYSFLRGDLRKEVLKFGYSRKNYGKEVTKQFDTWLDAIRNLRNHCCHHNRLVGNTSSIVLLDNVDDNQILANNDDLFSRLYALKKVLNSGDSNQLKTDLKRVIRNAKFNIYDLNILPNDWENKYNLIAPL